MCRAPLTVTQTLPPPPKYHSTDPNPNPNRELNLKTRQTIKIVVAHIIPLLYVFFSQIFIKCRQK